MIQLKHGKHSLPQIHTASTFTFDGKQYYWEGHSELYHRGPEGIKLIADFYPATTSGEEVVGRVQVYCDSEILCNIVIITCLILLKRM